LGKSKIKVVPVELVEMLQNMRAEINQHPLKDIVWTEKGSVVKVSQEHIETYTYTGLNNVDFVNTRFWEEDLAELNKG